MAPELHAPRSALLEDRLHTMQKWYGQAWLPTPGVYSYRHACGHRQDRPRPRPRAYQCARCHRIDGQWEPLDPAAPAADPPTRAAVRWQREAVAVVETDERWARRRVQAAEGEGRAGTLRRWRAWEAAAEVETCRAAAAAPRRPSTILGQLRALQGDTPTTIHQLLALYKQAVGVLSETLVDFHVYIGLYDAQDDVVTYSYTSPNCGLFLAGKRLQRFEVPQCPTFVTCLGETPSAAVVMETEFGGSVVPLGPSQAVGGFCVVPIKGLRGRPAAVLGMEMALPAELCRPVRPAEVAVVEEAGDFLSRATAACQEAAALQGLHCFAHGAAPALLPVYQEAVGIAAAVTGPGAAAYVALFSHGGQVLTVTAHAIEPGPLAHSNALLGAKLQRRGGAFWLRDQRMGPGAELYVPDVQMDERVRPFPCVGLQAPEESLLLLALHHPMGYMAGVLAVEYLPHGLDDECRHTLRRVAALTEAYTQPVWQRQQLDRLAPHAVDYVHALTGCPNVYMATTTALGHCQYVAATPAQEFLIGRVLPDGEGVSRGLLEEDRTLVAAHFRGVPGLALLRPELQFAEGAVLLAGLRLPSTPGEAGAPARGGVLGCDTLGTATTFAEADVRAVRQAVHFLRRAMAGEPAEALDAEKPFHSFGVTLDGWKEPLAFWRAVWADLLGRLQQLTADDIVALAAAERPSPPTVKVVQATLHLVGKPPGDVQDWLRGRQHLRPELLAALAALDPTTAPIGPGDRRVAAAEHALEGLTLHEMVGGGGMVELLLEWVCIARAIAQSARALQQQPLGDPLVDLLEGPDDAGPPPPPPGPAPALPVPSSEAPSPGDLADVQREEGQLEPSALPEGDTKASHDAAASVALDWEAALLEVEAADGPEAVRPQPEELGAYVFGGAGRAEDDGDGDSDADPYVDEYASN